MKKLIGVLVLLVLAFNTKAQPLFVKEEKVNQQIEIKYALGNATYTTLINALAEGNGKDRYHTHFTISLAQTIVTSAREPLQHSLVTSKKMKLSGDVFYKGFDMSEQLTPSQIQFDFKTWNQNHLLKSVSFSNLYVDLGVTIKVETSYDDSLGEVTNHTIENLLPVYSSRHIQQFNNRVQIINNYFSAATKLNEYIHLLLSIHPDDIDRFSLQQQMLTEANHSVEEIENKDYDSQLSLQQYDPAKLLNNLSLFHSQSAKVQHDLDFVFSTLHIAYYDRGMDLLSHKNNISAANYFQQSLQINPIFAPSLFQLALISYRNNNLNDALSKADAILSGMNADPDTRRLSYQLLNDIYESRLQPRGGGLHQSGSG